MQRLLFVRNGPTPGNVGAAASLVAAGGDDLGVVGARAGPARHQQQRGRLRGLPDAACPGRQARAVVTILQVQHSVFSSHTMP